MTVAEANEKLASYCSRLALTQGGERLSAAAASGLGLAGGFALVFDALEDFFPVNRDTLRRFDAQPDLIAFDTKDGDRNFVSDHECFAHSSRQNQHIDSPLPPAIRSALASAAKQIKQSRPAFLAAYTD